MTERRIDRRTFLKGGLLAGGLLAGGGAAIAELAKTEAEPAPTGVHGHHARHSPLPETSPQEPAALQPPPAHAHRGHGPNILVILVDQLRSPQWFTAAPAMTRLLPNISRLRREGVSFERHYTASNDCTPARAALLTGLYTHQTGCMITGGSTLDPGFPTWGTLLREQGYATWWFGKWHLTHGDNHWSVIRDAGSLEPYGFAGGTYPSPDGGPGQGWRVDPQIADQFDEWYAGANDEQPWCTTVSFVNPHDIAWWWRWSERVPAEALAPARVNALPANYETTEMLEAHRKPLLQRSLQQTAAASFGPVPLSGPEVEEGWLPFLDLYVKLQQMVDHHVGRVLRTLHSRPRVAENTIVVFTSDHGEYGASHGLRGKGGGAYEEAIRVPLIVKDPRGKLASAHRKPRTQLTSSVDVAPLLLSIASGSDAWRSERRHAHLASRADLAAILQNPRAKGRDYALHTTDEIVTEFATEEYAANAPLHVVALRTARAKYVTYSNWRPDATTQETTGQERELYDYRSRGGRLEIENAAGHSRLEPALHQLMTQALRTELRGTLPRHLHRAQKLGFENYFLTATKAARGATAARLRREENENGPLAPFGKHTFDGSRPVPAHPMPLTPAEREMLSGPRRGGLGRGGQGRGDDLGRGALRRPLPPKR